MGPESGRTFGLHAQALGVTIGNCRVPGRHLGLVLGGNILSGEAYFRLYP